MAGGFLPDIQLHQMESESFHQADGVLQSAVGDGGIAVSDEGVTDNLQLLQEALGVGEAIFHVGGRLRIDLRNDSRQGALDAVAHESHFAAVRLISKQINQMGKGMFGQLVVFGQPAQELLRWIAEASRKAKLVVQAVKTADIFLQHDPRLHTQGEDGRFRLDIGVAVAVTAYP